MNDEQQKKHLEASAQEMYDALQIAAVVFWKVSKHQAHLDANGCDEQLTACWQEIQTVLKRARGDFS